MRLGPGYVPRTNQTPWVPIRDVRAQHAAPLPQTTTDKTKPVRPLERRKPGGHSVLAPQLSWPRNLTETTG